jgi:precorrin isomerase
MPPRWRHATVEVELVRGDAITALLAALDPIEAPGPDAVVLLAAGLLGAFAWKRGWRA